jgi:hypothetical protein
MLLYILPFLAILLIAQSEPVQTTTEEVNADQNQVQQDTFDQAAAIKALEEKIKGKENLPSSEVFENIQILGQIPAGRLLKIMEFGFSRSLGVSCDHCHDPNAWEKENIPAKQVTREMWALVGKINGELLKDIKGLQSENPVVNCTTCHRGEVKPATNF